MDFESRLREVESMAGSEMSMDLFNEHYQSLLLEVNRLPKGKSEKLTRMSFLLRRQFLYLLSQYRLAKAANSKGEPEEITVRGEMS